MVTGACLQRDLFEDCGEAARQRLPEKYAEAGGADGLGEVPLLDVGVLLPELDDGHQGEGYGDGRAQGWWRHFFLWQGAAARFLLLALAMYSRMRNNTQH